MAPTSPTQARPPSFAGPLEKPSNLAAPCPACGGPMGASESSDYRRCGRCRARVSVAPEGRYDQGYYYHAGALDRRFAARAREQVQHLQRLSARFGFGFRSDRGSPRLLELGCGKGFFVEAALAAGFDAHGVDLCADAIAAGQGRGLARRLTCADARTLDHEGAWANFDLVVAWELLEHVEQPIEFLQSASQRLRPGGWIVGSTPNGDSSWIKALGPRWHGFEIPQFHRLYLTADGFAQAAQRAGLAAPACLSINERSGLFLLKNTATALAQQLWPQRAGLLRCLLAGGLALPHWLLERAAGRLPGVAGETLLFAAQRRP
jgi:SAM-dependent methyltransferase